MVKKILKSIFYLVNNILYRFGYSIQKTELKFKSINQKGRNGKEGMKISFTEGSYPIQRIVLSIDNKEIGRLDWQETIGHSSIDLHCIEVDKSYRGQGYGTKLMETLEKIARERRVASIHLFTGDDNDNALGLYKHHGYQEVKELAGCFFNREYQKNYRMFVKKL